VCYLSYDVLSGARGRRFEDGIGLVGRHVVDAHEEHVRVPVPVCTTAATSATTALVLPLNRQITRYFTSH